METILKLEHVTKKFSGLVAVNDLSLEMKERTIHALIGPNGSGKSTTINLITGFHKTTSGSIRYHDELIQDLPIYETARKGICRTFQNLKLCKSMSVLENVMLGGHQLGKQGLMSFLVNFKSAAAEEKMLKEKAEEILDFIGMYHLKDENVSNIAYGRQKVTELGRALMSQPKLLFLDEPAAGLNPTERVEFVDILLKTFESGIDLFLIEHNMDVVMNISNMITVINFGAKIAEGTPKEIQNNSEVIAAYLGDKYVARKEGAQC